MPGAASWHLGSVSAQSCVPRHAGLLQIGAQRGVGCESSCRVKHYVQLLERTVGPQHHRSGYMSPRAVELWCVLLWLCCGWIGGSVRRRRVSRVP
eukprot:scaffold14296_cov124-Isochrysis_galbana.AAC.2